MTARRALVVALLTLTSGCDALFGRPVTPAEFKDGTCALLEAAKIACQLAELTGRPCAFTPPGCSALEKAEEDRARRGRDGRGQGPGEVLGGPDEEPCRPSPKGSASPAPVPSAPASQ